MGIKFKKLIRYTVIFGMLLTIFFATERVSAGGAVSVQDCCLLVQYSTAASSNEYKPIGCRPLNLTSKPCDQTLLCNGTTDYLRSRTAGLCPVGLTKEMKVQCSSNSEFCAKQVVTQNCSGLTKAQCGTATGACFYSDARNRCLGLYDDTICSFLNESDCGKSKTCSYEGGKCVSKLQKELNEVYGKGETGVFLTACAIQGTCTNANDLIEVIVNIAKQMFGFIGIISFAFFIYGGVTMILSFGNAEKFKHGQQVLVAAVIGIVITFSAYLIVRFVLDALGVTQDFRVI